MAGLHVAEGVHEPTGFLRRYIFSTDHKIIGIQYFLTAMAVAVVAGLLAMLMRLQLAWPDVSRPWLEKIFPEAMAGGVMNPEFYLALVTMHGTLMVFFVVSFALLGGFGNFLIPLQIGARDMAFPFLNMLSYWTVVPATLIMLASFFVEGGAAAAGWTSYPPLSAVKEAIPGSGMGQTLWLLGMALFIASFTMGGLNYFVTIVNQRAKGMSMLRMPMTIWSLFFATILGLLAFPPLTAAAVMLLLDRHGGTSFFLPAGLFFGNKLLAHAGGTPLLWQHLFWFLGHPEVYVLILPALGIAFDVLAPFTRKPPFGYRMSIYSLVTIGFLSMVVWGHHMFVSGMSPYVGEFFSIGTMLITIPSAIIGLSLMASLWGAKMRFTTAMLFAIGLISLFGTGGFGGIFLGNATADIQLHDTYFVVGHFHFMIGGVTLFGIFAGTYYWFPKMFGRMLNEKLGKAHFWLTFVAFYGVFLGMHFTGLGGQPRRYYSFTTFEFLQPFRDWNVLITLCAFVLGATQFVFLVNFVWSLLRGPKSESNPWHATTLEWTTSSPAPHGNWGAALPEVHRWAYDYSVPNAPEDYTSQTVPAREVPVSL
ncbi:MAG: cbb3-type cytochrome c oxidase subunit I [Acidobacteria bacterium]|nr:cbb3-type cytochrome c oxidase subunit I [Acidobacteriota bacterium]